MSVETDPIPPVPDHTPPLKADESTRDAGKFLSQVWSRWFVSLRDKINVINESLVNLGNVSGDGFVSKNGAAWVARVITGVLGRTSVTNGDGASGNPTIDVVTTDLVAGSNVSFTGSGVDRIIDNGSGPLTINASGGGGGGSTLESRIMAATPTAFYKLNETSGTAIADSSGNGLNATLVGSNYTMGVAGLVPGSSDTCISFGGTDAYIVIGQPSALNFGSTDTFTVLALVEYNTFNPANGASVSKAITSDRLMHMDTATNCLFWNSAGTTINPTSLNAFTAMNVQFLGKPMAPVFVRRYVNSTLYMEAWCNGYFIGRSSVSHAGASGIDWLIGARRATNNSTTSNFINAKVQYVAIFNRDLSMAEIQSISYAID